MGPNTAVALKIIRDGKAQTVNVMLGQLADHKVRKASADDRGGKESGSLGLTLAPAAQVEGAGKKGLAVLGVDPNRQAAELSIQQGDIILQAGNKALTGSGDLTSAMAQAKATGRKVMLLLVKHEQADRYVAIPVAVG
jgi:serine protease Do